MRTILITILLFSTTTLFSQTFTVGSLFSESSNNGKIEGVVIDKDANNEPLPFTTVIVKNSSRLLTTNLKGRFLISLKPGTYTLIFSFPGYKSIEVENIKVVSNNTAICNQTMTSLKINSDISSISFPK